MTIRKAEKSDIPRLIELSYLFETSPFAFDLRFRNLTGQYYPVYAEDALKTPNTITYLIEESAVIVGYISFAVNPQLSKIIPDYKIANILLLVVRKDYRGRSIGKTLVNACMNIFQKMRVNLITVGTDAYNLPAIQTYEACGFRTTMVWHIYRYYANDTRLTEPSDKVDVYNLGNLEEFRNYFNRPISLFKDKKIDRTRLFEALSDSFVKKIAQGDGTLFAYYDAGKTTGLIQVKEDATSMKSLNLQKAIYRITDIIAMEHKETVYQELIRYIALRLQNYALLEVWADAEDTELIHASEKCNFQLSYTGVSLHYHLDR